MMGVDVCQGAPNNPIERLAEGMSSADWTGLDWIGKAIHVDQERLVASTHYGTTV